MERCYAIEMTSQFKKGIKRARRQGKNLKKLEEVIDLLARGIPLPERCRDHELKGAWSAHRECHVEPDWLLIYYYRSEVLVLTLAATGTHSELFS